MPDRQSFANRAPRAVLAWESLPGHGVGIPRALLLLLLTLGAWGAWGAWGTGGPGAAHAEEASPSTPEPIPTTPTPTPATPRVRTFGFDAADGGVIPLHGGRVLRVIPGATEAERSRASVIRVADGKVLASTALSGTAGVGALPVTEDGSADLRWDEDGRVVVDLDDAAVAPTLPVARLRIRPLEGGEVEILTPSGEPVALDPAKPTKVILPNGVEVECSPLGNCAALVTALDGAVAVETDFGGALFGKGAASHVFVAPDRFMIAPRSGTVRLARRDGPPGSGRALMVEAGLGDGAVGLSANGRFLRTTGDPLRPETLTPEPVANRGTPLPNNIGLSGVHWSSLDPVREEDGTGPFAPENGAASDPLRRALEARRRRMIGDEAGSMDLALLEIDVTTGGRDGEEAASDEEGGADDAEADAEGLDALEAALDAGDLARADAASDAIREALRTTDLLPEQPLRGISGP